MAAVPRAASRRSPIHSDGNSTPADASSPVLTRHGAVYDVNPEKAGGVVGAGARPGPGMAWGRQVVLDDLCRAPWPILTTLVVDAHPVSLGRLHGSPCTRRRAGPAYPLERQL